MNAGEKNIMFNHYLDDYLTIGYYGTDGLNMESRFVI
jgi:hypothetical protein